jgi:hypothetical protein
MKKAKMFIDSFKSSLVDKIDLWKSKSLDISECQSVCLALGPYRNLTTLTAATLFLHPGCQVLNHAGMRIYGNPEVDFLSTYNKSTLDRFVQYAIQISGKGNRGNRGGAITHSHAFDDKYGMKAIQKKLAPEKRKKNIQCLFWKESLKTSNLIREKKVDLGAIFAQDQRLRFLLPIRNPMDCARSNLSTGHADLFVGIDAAPSISGMTKAVLDEIYWFAEWQSRYPDRFFYFFEHEISETMLKNMASFLGLDPDPAWLEGALAAMKVKTGYAHSDALLAEYRSYVGEKFANFPEISGKLLQFSS